MQLNAAKVILACRSLDKAVKAKQDIEESTKRTGVVDVWQLDLASFDSVKEFAARVSGLERLDIVINNASVLTTTWEISENHELQLTVNVISTVLLSLLLLPFLRRTGLQFNITPHLVIVSSDGAFLVSSCDPVPLIYTHSLTVFLAFLLPLGRISREEIKIYYAGS